MDQQGLTQLYILKPFFRNPTKVQKQVSIGFADRCIPSANVRLFKYNLTYVMIIQVFHTPKEWANIVYFVSDPNKYDKNIVACQVWVILVTSFALCEIWDHIYKMLKYA